MAETNTTRLSLRRWSAGTDTPSRTEFDGDNASLESLTAIDKQDTFANRPSAGVRGTYFWDTTNAFLWRDDGSAWSTVGAKAQNVVASSSAAGNVPLTANAITSQTADLLQLKVNGTTKYSVDKDGSATGNKRVGTSIALTNVTVGDRVIDAVGAASQSGDMLRLRSNDGTDLLKVAASGEVSGVALNAGSGKALIGNSAYSNAANMTLFSGTPALEVYANTGGAGTTFNDFIYLRHQAADATVVARRLGLLMKVGDETSGDAARTGAIYIESAAASFGAAKLILARADSPVMTFDATPLATVAVPLTVAGRVTAATGTAHSYAMGGADIGMLQQGNHVAFRAGSSAGFYWYRQGVYSNTPGAPGSGGTQLAQLDLNGVYSAPNIFATSNLEVTLGTNVAGLMAGSPSSLNTQVSRDAVQARVNGAASPLAFNPLGGDINMGDDTSVINVFGKFELQGRAVTISATQPGSPSTGDIWIDIS